MVVGEHVAKILVGRANYLKKDKYLFAVLHPFCPSTWGHYRLIKWPTKEVISRCHTLIIIITQK